MNLTWKNSVKCALNTPSATAVGSAISNTWGEAGIQIGLIDQAAQGPQAANLVEVDLEANLEHPGLSPRVGARRVAPLTAQVLALDLPLRLDPVVVAGEIFTVQEDGHTPGI